MKKTSFLLVLFLFNHALCSFTFAQSDDSRIKLSIGTDLVSRYVWRGSQYSTNPCIQPGIEANIGNLTFGAWGSYAFDGLPFNAEADLYLTYSFADQMFSATITDYFFPADVIGGKNKYFVYDQDKTGHLLEATLTFNGTDNIPVKFLAAMNFYGADNKKIEDNPVSPDFNQTTENQYSTYLELSFPFSVSETGMNVFAGFTPNDPKEDDPETGYIGESGFYGDSMGFVNLGLTASKKIQISKTYSLPVSCSFVVNPMSENVFIVFGLSL